jgi:tRNA 2-selenouridine synthase
MVERLQTEAFIKLARQHPVIDVRAPSEYSAAHLPMANNIPLLNDAERETIGTTYKEMGRRDAIRRGLDLVGPRMRQLVEDAETIADTEILPLYCARGGMRSGAMGWLLETSGLNPIVLDGGYKAFRKWVLSQLESILNLVVIGGLTGSGKTLVLQALHEQGEQVIDLEGLAHHFGSAFGSIGQPPQPTQAQFENELAWVIGSIDSSKVVWVEDESRMVGRCSVAPPLHEQMRKAPVAVLERSIDERIAILASLYCGDDKSELIACTHRISKRLGGQRTRDALAQIEAGNMREAIALVLHYYDGTYSYGLSQREDRTLSPMAVTGLNAEEVARQLITWIADVR